MTGKDIAIIVLAILLVIAILVIVGLLFNGEMKKFVIEKMEEAEKSGKSGLDKFMYVFNAFKEKYKIIQFLLNIEKFIKYIISITKTINCNPTSATKK